MMEEDYVSYETARLLKEKGFDVSCLAHWFIGNEAHEKFSDYPFNWNEVKSDLDWLSRPTQQMAMKWLREEFDLITYIKLVNDEDLCHDAWGFSIYNKFTNESIKGHRLWFKYEEACEAAIKYCLKNLI